MRKPLGLGAALALAACGAGQPVGTSPATRSPASAPTATESMTGTSPNPGAGSAAPAGTVNPPQTTATPTSAPAAVPVPRATALADKLGALQLDPQDLPKFDDLTPTQLRGVMKLFTESLHAKCSDCHETDFAAPTRRKRIAVHMWDDLVRRFSVVSDTALSGGPGAEPSARPAPLFCDSCHQQQMKPLVRADEAQLEASMKASFVDGLKRKDEQEMACTACHASEADFALLDKWSR